VLTSTAEGSGSARAAGEGEAMGEDLPELDAKVAATAAAATSGAAASAR
jgi:hypothetical protein